MSRCTSTYAALLLVTLATASLAQAHYQSRGRQLLQQFKKEEKVTGSQKPEFKYESKSSQDGVTVKKTTTVQQQGKPEFKYEKKEPKTYYESSSKSEFKGPDNKVESKHTTDKDGNKIYTFKTGKRAFEYTHSTKHQVNFPSTEIVATGGKPMVVEHKTVVQGPIKEEKATWTSGNGPTYESKWSFSSGNHGHRL